MVIKDKFTLLKDVPNVFHLPGTSLDKFSITKGLSKIYSSLKLIEDRINHFSKNSVFKLLEENKTDKKFISLVKIPNYPLPVSYNYNTKTIIINLQSFDTDDISRIDPRNIYACVVYGICFRDLITEKIKIPENFYMAVSSFITTVLMRLFGKEFGLLGVYATSIPLLKFLTSCYILSSLFGENDKTKLYKKASISSIVDYRQYVDELSNYDFSDIGNYIKSLSNFKVMPGITKHTFAAKIYKSLSIYFLPSLEDFSRLVSIISITDLPGNNISPTFISKYNKSEYDKILSISKKIFK